MFLMKTKVPEKLWDLFATDFIRVLQGKNNKMVLQAYMRFRRTE